MKKLIKFLQPKKMEKKRLLVSPIEREELEKKAVEGAKKAVKEYRRVFERLAEYDRT
ncbi:MAG: hypothetical protein HY093_04435 [Candidatus Liptonbacteria bacterium]|nr:hypothetical protein [Candidatus Liptonbacteria bacterium]